MRKKSVSYKVKIQAVGDTWKCAFYDKDTDCQWLMYKNVPLKDGDDAVLTITRENNYDKLITMALIRAGRAIMKAHKLTKETL